MGFLSGLFNFSGGGVGNSASTSEQKTKNSDMRVVGGDSSVNTSQAFDLSGQTGGTVNLTATDFGAVQGALKLATTTVQGQQQANKDTLAANGSILDNALHTLGDQQAAFTSAVENIKTNDKTLAIAGAVVVAAIAAAMYFRKG